MKLQFYIDGNDADRCRESHRLNKPIAVGGTDTLTGRVKSYSGVVLCVEHSSSGAPGECWRVTIDTE